MALLATIMSASPSGTAPPMACPVPLGQPWGCRNLFVLPTHPMLSCMDLWWSSHWYDHHPEPVCAFYTLTPSRTLGSSVVQWLVLQPSQLPCSLSMWYPKTPPTPLQRCFPSIVLHVDTTNSSSQARKLSSGRLIELLWSNCELT